MGRAISGRRAVLLVVAVIISGVGAGLFAFLDRKAPFLGSKVHEERTNLDGIRTHMEMFFASRGAFIDIAPQPALPDSSEMRRTPREFGEQPCAPECAGDLAKCDRFACLGWRPTSRVYASYACATTRTATISDYTCAAVSDRDGDGRLSVSVYGTNRGGGPQLVAPLPPLARGLGCLEASLPAGEVTACGAPAP